MGLDLSPVANKLLRKLAAPKESGYISLKRVVAEVRDPLTGEIITPGTEEILGLNGAVRSMDDSFVDGSRILITDKLVVIDGLIEPLQGDRLVIGGVEHTFTLINEKNHAGVVQVYNLAARK